jgi:tetratricopeptide (TPR) repeat protein
MIPMRLICSAAVVTLSLIVGCDTAADPQVQTDATARVDRAEQLLSAGKAKDADAVVDGLLEQHSDDWRVHDLSARVYLQQGLRLQDEGLMEQSHAALVKAVAAYRNATNLVPALAGLYTSAGNAAVMAGDEEQAKIWFREAIGLDAEDVRPSLYLAQLVFEDDPSEARSLLDWVLSMDSSVPEAHASIALLNAINGDAAAAEAAMAEALRRDRAPSIRVVQARMFRMLGEPSRGVEVLLVIEPSARTTEAAAAELAACWGAIGRPDRVADAWDACFSANAHRTDAWRYALNAARAHLEAGNRSAAARSVEQAEMLSAPASEVAKVRATAARQID